MVVPGDNKFKTQISIQTYTKGDINMGGTKLWFCVIIKQKIPFKYLAVKVV